MMGIMAFTCGGRGDLDLTPPGLDFSLFLFEVRSHCDPLINVLIGGRCHVVH